MMESVIGLLADRETAQRVRSALLEAGCAEKNVVVFDRSAGNSLVDELADRGLAPARVDRLAVGGDVADVGEVVLADPGLGAGVERLELLGEACGAREGSVGTNIAGESHDCDGRHRAARPEGQQRARN